MQIANANEKKIMKKVFLIGDSIRIGYDKAVRAKLSGEAEVYFTVDNNRFAQYILCSISALTGSSENATPRALM